VNADTIRLRRTPCSCCLMPWHCDLCPKSPDQNRMLQLSDASLLLRQVATVAAAAAVAAAIPAAAAAKGLVPEQRAPAAAATGQPVVVTSTGAAAGAARGGVTSQPLSPASVSSTPTSSASGRSGIVARKLVSKGPETTNPGMTRKEVVEALGATLVCLQISPSLTVVVGSYSTVTLPCFHVCDLGNLV